MEQETSNINNALLRLHAHFQENLDSLRTVFNNEDTLPELLDVIKKYINNKDEASFIQSITAMIQTNT